MTSTPGAQNGTPTEQRPQKTPPKHEGTPRDPFIRAENEDDDGYDPYSDRRPDPEPLFERDPWG